MLWLSLFSKIFIFANSTASLLPSPLITPPPSHLPIPIIRQATEYSCGAASLLAVLYYWRVYDGTESSLYKMLNTTEAEGTDPLYMVKAARGFGLKAYMKEHLKLSDLRSALRRGDTVILDLQAWRIKEEEKLPWKKVWESGHYIVLTAMDNHYLYAMDPSAGAGYAYLALNEFLTRWHDYERRGDKIKKYHRLGIFIRGKKPIQRFPTPFIKIE